MKITGQTKIQGNEIADLNARTVAGMTAQGSICASSNVTIDDTYKIADEIAQKSWQRYGDYKSKDRYTYNLIPSVRTEVTFPTCRDIGISYSRILLHDTMIKSHSFRTGTPDMPLCDCRNKEETVDS